MPCLAVVVANDEARGIARIENGGASVGIDGRRVELLAQAVAERQTAGGMEFIRKIGAEIVQAIVAAGIARLRVGEEGPPRRKSEIAVPETDPNAIAE